LIYFVYFYENRATKSVNIVEEERKRMRKNDGGAESNQGTLYTLIQMSPPVQLMYPNKNVK
jgi:hypothetical protein